MKGGREEIEGRKRGDAISFVRSIIFSPEHQGHVPVKRVGGKKSSAVVKLPSPRTIRSDQRGDEGEPAACGGEEVDDLRLIRADRLTD